MKIVDENGKLFKKFNLVDAIVALLLVIIVIAIGWKVVSGVITARQEKAAEEAAENYENSPHMSFDVICTEVPRKVAESFQDQMKRPMADRQLMSMGKPLEGYITGCTFTPDDAEDEASLCTVLFTIECVPAVTDDGIYSIGTQEVRIGKPHIVKTYTIEYSGWVYSMELPPETEKEEPADE